MAYRLIYTARANDHLRALTARQRATLTDQVERQLAHQPTVATRNRKPMEPNLLAPWELRIGDIRVYYEVVEEEEPCVFIYAIGVKIRNRVRIAGEEVEFP